MEREERGWREAARGEKSNRTLEGRMEENQWPNEGKNSNHKYNNRNRETLLIKPRLPQTPNHLLPRKQVGGEREKG